MKKSLLTLLSFSVFLAVSLTSCQKESVGTTTFEATMEECEDEDGKVAFTSIACWIAAQNDDYDWQGTTGVTLDFDMKWVPWPVGPHGNQETNAGKVASGSYYMIPVGTEDPELVYNVFRDLHDWYHGELRERHPGGHGQDLQDRRKPRSWHVPLLLPCGQHVLRQRLRDAVHRQRARAGEHHV